MILTQLSNSTSVNLQPVAHIQSFRDTSPGGPLVDITPNYLLYAPSSQGEKHSKDFLAYTRLPFTTPATGSAGNHLMRYPFLLQDDERILAFQLDESQGLLAVITSYASQPIAALQFLSFPGTDFHPLTTASQARIYLHVKGIHTCQVQIHEDRVGVLLCGETNSLTIYDWKTCRTTVQYTPTCGQSITAFSFLAANAMVTTNLSTLQIELWEILPDRKILQRTGFLGLPAIQPGIVVEGLDCTPLSPGQFLNSQISPVITFNLLMCKETPNGFISYCLVKFVVYMATLFDLGFSNVHPPTCDTNRHFPWAAWGPTAARCFDESYAVDHCNLGGQYFVSLSDVETVEPYSLSIYDFGGTGCPENMEKLEARFHCEELQHDPVFDEDVYTLKPRPRYQAIVPSNKVLVDHDRIFVFKYREENEDDDFSITTYSF